MAVSALITVLSRILLIAGSEPLNEVRIVGKALELAVRRTTVAFRRCSGSESRRMKSKPQSSSASSVGPPMLSGWQRLSNALIRRACPGQPASGGQRPPYVGFSGTSDISAARFGSAIRGARTRNGRRIMRDNPRTEWRIEIVPTFGSCPMNPGREFNRPALQCGRRLHPNRTWRVVRMHGFIRGTC